jgi:CheY-like chemotaxis protein
VNNGSVRLSNNQGRLCHHDFASAKSGWLIKTLLTLREVPGLISESGWFLCQRRDDHGVPGVWLIMPPDGIATSGSGLRVLLVEDEAVIAELFAESLLADGHHVAIATDGQEALTLFEEAEAGGRPYDIVVTDVRMPRMDGVTLARRLRGQHPDLPVVVVSGYAPAEQLSGLAAVKNAPVVILPKPVKLSRLRSAVLSATQH